MARLLCQGNAGRASDPPLRTAMQEQLKDVLRRVHGRAGVAGHRRYTGPLPREARPGVDAAEGPGQSLFPGAAGAGRPGAGVPGGQPGLAEAAGGQRGAALLRGAACPVDGAGGAGPAAVATRPGAAATAVGPGAGGNTHRAVPAIGLCHSRPVRRLRPQPLQPQVAGAAGQRGLLHLQRRGPGAGQGLPAGPLAAQGASAGHCVPGPAHRLSERTPGPGDQPPIGRGGRPVPGAASAAHGRRTHAGHGHSPGWRPRGGHGLPERAARLRVAIAGAA